MRLMIFSGLMLMSAFLIADPLPKATEGCNNFGTSAVSLSTSTATLILAADTTRKGWEIKNASGYTVRISSYANTSQSSGYPLYSSATGLTLADSGECIESAIYGISTHTSAVSVDVIWKTNTK